MLAMVTMQNNQLKANNYLEFQLRRTQLQQTLIGQFLNDPDNCACLFAGASPFSNNPAAPGATLTGVSPTQIGQYNFITAGDCGTATIPVPFVNSTGIDHMKSTSIELKNIRNISGTYSGNLVINLESTREVLGPNKLPLSIPVSIAVSTVSSGTVAFSSCSTSGLSQFSEQLSLALSSITSHEERICWRNNDLNKLTVDCPADTALLTCSGGPGDMDSDHEGFWVLSDYSINRCTLQIKKPRCVSGESWTEQRIIANCYPI